jgi:hypothetical protein
LAPAISAEGNDLERLLRSFAVVVAALSLAACSTLSASPVGGISNTAQTNAQSKATPPRAYTVTIKNGTEEILTVVPGGKCSSDLRFHNRTFAPGETQHATLDFKSKCLGFALARGTFGGTGFFYYIQADHTVVSRIESHSYAECLTVASTSLDITIVKCS